MADVGGAGVVVVHPMRGTGRVDQRNVALGDELDVGAVASPLPQGSAEMSFGLIAAVDVGMVEARDPELETAVDQPGELGGRVGRLAGDGAPGTPDEARQLGAAGMQVLTAHGHPGSSRAFRDGNWS